MSSRVLPLPCSVLDHVALAEREVGEGVVSAESWERLRAIVDPLPPVAHEAGLEVRLDGDPRVDLSVCVQAGPPARGAIVDALERSGAPARSSGWRRGLSFLRAWASPDSPLHEPVHALWLEFDAHGVGPPEPFLLFSLDGDRLYPDGTANTDQLEDAVREGLDRLAEGLDPRVRSAVERCLRRLPRYAQLRHAAVRPTPAGDLVRLIVRMPWRRLTAALVELGWPGDPIELDGLLEHLCHDTPVVPVNVDLTAEGMGPRVGIELVRAGAPRTSAPWQRVFGVLESLGACKPERSAAVSDWGGQRLGQELGPGRFCVRRDLMVKAVYETGAPLAAKAYLAFAPRLLVKQTPAEP